MQIQDCQNFRRVLRGTPNTPNTQGLEVTIPIPLIDCDKLQHGDLIVDGGVISLVS